MTKSKQPGPALFDLLGPTQEDVNRNLRVPDTERPTPSKPAEASPEQVERAIVPGRQEPSTTPHERSAAPNRVGTRRLIQFDDECVHLSLTSLSAAIVVFVLMVGLLGVYELGRTNGQASGFGEGHRTGRASFEADAASEIEAARHKPPASHLVEGLLQSSAGQPGTSQTATPQSSAPDNPGQRMAAAWVQGHTYVVAQEFAPQSKDDVRAAKSYLQTKGIDTATIKLDTGWFQLITTQGFDRSDPVQRDLADRLLAKVHRAGAAYYSGGGGYKLEGYFKTLRKRSW